MSAFSKQQVVVLQGTSFQTADVKCSGFIIYKAHISLFTRVTSTETPLRAAAVAAAGSLSTFVSICCLLLLLFVVVLVHAPPLNTWFSFVWVFKMQTGR